MDASKLSRACKYGRDGAADQCLDGEHIHLSVSRVWCGVPGLLGEVWVSNSVRGDSVIWVLLDMVPGMYSIF